jgi:hypothetical protein
MKDNHQGGRAYLGFNRATVLTEFASPSRQEQNMSCDTFDPKRGCHRSL